MAPHVRHEPCSKCGSSDAGSRRANGDLFCFACEKTVERGGEITETAAEEIKRDWTPLHGVSKDLPKRGLKETTLKFWRYEVGDDCQIANYFENGELVAQKIRRAGKVFSVNGNGKDMPLYGQWLWTSGKNITITEGEIDALSVSQAMENKWPVVSLPNGAQSAEKAIAQAYEYLDRFERIVLMFDMDRPGRDAVEKIAPLLPMGKVAVAQLPEKDANEVLTKHGAAALVNAFWRAPTWRPDGIVAGTEITLDQLRSHAVKGYELPYKKLQDAMLGLRKGELTLFTAGSGIGKSTLMRELAYHLQTTHSLKIGNVFLEEGNVKTAQGYIAIDNNVPLGKLRHNPDLINEKDWLRSKADVTDKMFFYNHFGSLDSKNLLTKLRYMAQVCHIDFICLDHISIVTSGMESSSEGERKDIDILMTRLRSLVEETGVGVLGIVHLKRVHGKEFNEGARVSLSDLRGSASLEQLSDNVIGLERNQQSKTKPTLMRCRLLKCRELGFESGECDLLNYSLATGRIVLAEAKQFEEDEEEL
jgi:twinkle protein